MEEGGPEGVGTGRVEGWFTKGAVVVGFEFPRIVLLKFGGQGWGWR